MQRSLVRAGLEVAVQHPALILWYLQNRLRQALLPLERLSGSGRALLPRYVTLKPTLRCNLRCPFCRFVANGEVAGGRDWLEPEDWLRVVDEIAPYRPYVCLTGGEPLLYPHLPELISRIRSHGLICVLTTNGTLLEQKAPLLAESPPDVVILSVDGPREVHDRARVAAGVYDRALRGARALQAATGGSRRSRLVLNTALTGHTWESAREMVEVARQFGAFALHFQHFWFMTRAMTEAHNQQWGHCFPLDPERLGLTGTTGVDTDELFETVQQLQREDPGFPVLVYPELDREAMRRYYTQPEEFLHQRVPDCAWTSTDILPNGDVSPCFELTCGNVLRQPFREIWNSVPFREHRRRLTEHGPYPVCARCCAYFRED